MQNHCKTWWKRYICGVLGAFWVWVLAWRYFITQVGNSITENEYGICYLFMFASSSRGVASCLMIPWSKYYFIHDCLSNIDPCLGDCALLEGMCSFCFLPRFFCVSCVWCIGVVYLCVPLGAWFIWLPNVQEFLAFWNCIHSFILSGHQLTYQL